jgi:alpha-beta hydrolase superfamily lysophospholipase
MQKILFIILSLYSFSLFAIKPDSTYVLYPKQLHLQYDSLNMTTKDGYRLTGWLCKAKDFPKSPTVIICGGDAGNMSYYAGLASNFVQLAHYSVLLFDYRGFGKSQTFRINRDTLTYPEFLTDINGVIDYYRKNYSDSGKVILYGMSMGGALALGVSAMRKDLYAVVAESPYVSQELIAKHYLKGDKNKAPIRYFKDRYLEPLQIAPEIKCDRVLLVHGDADTHIETKDIEALYTKIPSKHKDLWISGNTRHLGFWQKETGEMFLDMFYDFTK